MYSSQIIKAGSVHKEAERIIIPHVLPDDEVKRLSELGEAIHKEKIAAVENQASQLREKVEKEKEKLLKDARDQAAEIIQNANLKKNEILKTAQSEKNKIHDDASQAGKKEGYDAGFEKGIEEGIFLFKRLNRLLEIIANIRIDLVEKTKNDIANISAKIAHAIIRKTVLKDPQTILRTVEAALNKVRGKDTVIIRINPSDIPVAKEHLESFYQQVRGLSHIELKPDTGLDPGGAIIETDLGKIDASIQGQLESFQQALNTASIKDSIPLEPLQPDPPPASAVSVLAEKNIEARRMSPPVTGSSAPSTLINP